MLFINADDWGLRQDVTDRSLQCHENGRITAVSAMVLMDDSERAAALALEKGIDVGLHLNFTLPFTKPVRDGVVAERQRRIAEFLGPQGYTRLVYHPGLRADFVSVYRAQVAEFHRLYGRMPSRIDGHHHMHLCANMLVDGVIPAGQRVRRNLTFFKGERGWLNRCYRKAVNAWIARRYRCTDHLFRTLPITRNDRMRRIMDLARVSQVELAVHPDNPEEYAFLMSDDFLRYTAGVVKTRFEES